MNKKTIKIIIILAILVLVGFAALFVINNYRGEDGLTYSERKSLEKNGEAVVDWEAMEEAQQEDSFFARLFNNGNDKDQTSTTSDKNDDGSGNADQQNSGDDSKKPASDSDKNSDDDKASNDDKDDNTGDDSQSDSDQDSDDGKDSGSELTGDAKAYADYIAMSPEKQEAYFETFDSPEAFIKWHNKAKAAYDAANKSVQVEGGGIDIGDYQ